MSFIDHALCSLDCSSWAPITSASVALLAAPAHANDDVQLWTAVSATGPVKGELALWVEGQLRAGTGISRVTQRNLRVGIGWESDPAFFSLRRLCGPTPHSRPTALPQRSIARGNSYARARSLANRSTDQRAAPRSTTTSSIGCGCRKKGRLSISPNAAAAAN